MESLEESLKKHTGIDGGLQRQMETEVSKWHEILIYILDITLFLNERSLSSRGSSNRVGDPDKMVFF